MIFTALINVAFNVLVWCFDAFNLGDVVWASDPDHMVFFFEFVRVGCYFFPMDTVLQIIGLIIGFSLFRLGVRIVKTIWELLPFI